jgi:TPR repeat protein
MDPFRDPSYIAACEAQARGNLEEARTHFERAAAEGNHVALGELCAVCDQLGDLAAVRLHAKRLEALALMSSEVSYVAAKCLDLCSNTFGFDGASEKRVKFLLNAAEIGNPVAQLEVAANYAEGSNGFARSRVQAREWVRRAMRSMPSEAIPQWAREILENDA